MKTAWLERDEVLRQLRKAAVSLKRSCPEVEEIILVGSLARGDHTGTSDADVLLLLSGSDLNPVERLRRYLPFFDLPIGVDILPFTREELEKWGGRNARLGTMLSEGITLA